MANNNIPVSRHTQHEDGSIRITYTEGSGNGYDVSGLKHRIFDINVAAPQYFFSSLTDGTSKVSSNPFTGNTTFTINGKPYTMYSTANGKYNLYDMIAIAVDAGYDYDEIDAVLETNDWTNNLYSDNKNNLPKGYTSFSQYVNERTHPAVAQLLDKVKADYGALNPTLTSKLGTNGKYTFILEYVDPTTGKRTSASLDPNGFNLDGNGKFKSDADLINAVKGTNIAYADAAWKEYDAATTLKNNAQTQVNTAKEGLAALGLGYKPVYDKDGNVVSYNVTGNSTVGSNGNAYQTLSQADINAVTAKTPGTDNLTAWNKNKNTSILGKINGNFASASGKSNSLNRLSLKELQDIVDLVVEEDTDKTTRTIDNTKAQLLAQIKRDPQLYNSLVQQFRADNAAGTIAGQRAANVQDTTQEFNQTYDEAASNLYKGLFEGENNVAANTRQNTITKKTDGLESYIQAQLNQASQDANNEATLTQNIATAMDSLSAALDVDADKYKNAADVNASIADAKLSQLSSKISGDTNKTISDQDAALQAIADMYDVSINTLKDGMANNVDVANAVKTISNAFNTLSSGAGGYGVVNAPTSDKVKNFTNKQYNDTVNNKTFQSYIDNAKALTKTYTPEEILKEYGLDVLASDESFMQQYVQYAEEANQESNKVFNDAQRAYIAAVTAGDTKTSEQLTRLATSTSGTKGNLYAASALANQYNQQTGLFNTGRQLATDYQNQQSANNTAIYDAMLKAYDDRTNFLGNGYANSDKGTLYGIVNTLNQNAAARLDAFTKLNDKYMKTTQSMNNTNANLTSGTNRRLGNLAGNLTLSNAQIYSNNTRNMSSRNKLAAQMLGTLATGQATVDNYAKKYGNK